MENNQNLPIPVADNPRPPLPAAAEGTGAIIEDKFSFGTIRGQHKDEDGHMITESGLIHVESLLSRAKKTEASQSKWGFVSNALSASITAAIFALTFIITPLCDSSFKIPNWLNLILGALLISSLVLSYVFFKIDSAKSTDWNTFYKDYIEEALELLKKIRNTE